MVDLGRRDGECRGAPSAFRDGAATPRHRVMRNKKGPGGPDCPSALADSPDPRRSRAVFMSRGGAVASSSQPAPSRLRSHGRHVAPRTGRLSLSTSGCTAARDGAQTVPVAGYAVSPGPDRRENFGPLPCHRYNGLTELSSMSLNMISSGTEMPLRNCARSGLVLLFSARHLRSPSTSEQLRAQSHEALDEGELDANRLRGDWYGEHGESVQADVPHRIV